MDALSFELRQIIVKYCSRIDDGCTIRAVASLSRYFRDLVLPGLYEVISVNDSPSRGALCSLADTLERRGSQLIYHLSVSIVVADSDGSSSGDSWYYADALGAILRMAAPSVRTLSISLWNSPTSKYRKGPLRYTLKDFLSKTAPCLRELTILTNYFMDYDDQKHQDIS